MFYDLDIFIYPHLLCSATFIYMYISNAEKQTEINSYMPNIFGKNSHMPNN